ncbi:hypothetical protein Lesp02_41910 [Lentzea sp. NBRC 105346]|uniref:hypothetical protein n=1 Tax=Lentzea sp. NBRC 105346 TaxID=3032205 RepID=UPI0024A17CC4|nr:hypothetical protein [Lentzea sp. NBRC 105346]GLZ32003.1 hypothetical protein Lesp02_41910 [Lentzea sp. NBRC 105346]
MPLSMDLSERQSRLYDCACCGRPFERVWACVERDDRLVGVYYANNYHHRGKGPETYIDVILGTWGKDTVADHVTFGCRVGPVGGSSEPDANYWQPCLDGSATAMHGHLLSVEEAKKHPWLAEFWNVIELVLAKDPAVNWHLYGRRRQPHQSE